MTKNKPKTNVGQPEEQASPPRKPAIPTITSVSIKQQAKPDKAKVFIHEAKPTVH